MRERASEGARSLFDVALCTPYAVCMTHSINMRRGVLVAIMALMAVFVVTSPARANLTASPAQTIIPGYPDSMQADTPVGPQQAAICTSDLANNVCGAGTPSAKDLADPGPGGDAEAFYWSGAAEADLDGSAIGIAFDVEVATVGGDTDLGTGPTQGSFQRIQMSGDLALPNGTYTFVTPFGTFTAAKTNLTDSRNNWKRIETASADVGPVDHFLTQVGAPAGFYGNGDADPVPTTDGAQVSVYVPGHNPTDTDILGNVLPPDAVATEWAILGAQVGNPVNLPPADTDGDGVPDASDNCPAVAGVGPSGCPNPKPPVVNSPVVNPVSNPQQPQVITRTVNNTVIRPAPVVNTPVAQQSFTGRVTGVSIRKGVLRARSPRGADVVRITVRKGGKFVKRLTVRVNDNGQRFTRTLTRKAGRYTATIQAGNEQHDVVSFGPAVRRSFRVV